MIYDGCRYDTLEPKYSTANSHPLVLPEVFPLVARVLSGNKESSVSPLVAAAIPLYTRLIGFHGFVNVVSYRLPFGI